ncbi:MAG: DNA polymerase III subunit delta [Muribaculaceae bacterium]|nr:DNA polymerase III subunit delta [Muribaculaceae bacterium]
MAEKKTTVTYTSLRNEVNGGKFRPIYVLHGEEPYYIDALSNLIVERALSEDERDFNLTVYYGDSADVREVIATCKQFPAFAPRRVVVLREAQLVAKQPGGGHKDDLDLFEAYAANPLMSTVLVICHKGGAIKAKAFTDELKKSHEGGAMPGVVMDSPKVRYDRDLRALIANYATSMGCNIDTKSVVMLADFIGNDLARLFGELDKLSILVGDTHAITPELIERNVGISKDYNNFELEDALISHNAAKAYRIIDYYEKNPKNNPVQPTLAMLFGFFSNVLIVQTNRDQSQAALMEATGKASPYRMKKFVEASRSYSKQGVVNIIRYVRECDVKSKGIGSRQDSYALLRELIYKILHS